MLVYHTCPDTIASIPYHRGPTMSSAGCAHLGDTGIVCTCGCQDDHSAFDKRVVALPFWPVRLHAQGKWVVKMERGGWVACLFQPGFVFIWPLNTRGFDGGKTGGASVFVAWGASERSGFSEQALHGARCDSSASGQHQSRSACRMMASSSEC